MPTYMEKHLLVGFDYETDWPVFYCPYTLEITLADLISRKIEESEACI